MIFYSCLESVASFAIDLVLNLLINLSVDELRGTSSFISVIICFEINLIFHFCYYLFSFL